MGKESVEVRVGAGGYAELLVCRRIASGSGNIGVFKEWGGNICESISEGKCVYEKGWVW
jgi:hypothetical protein